MLTSRAVGWVPMDLNLVDKVNNCDQRSIRLSVGRPLTFMLTKLPSNFLPFCVSVVSPCSVWCTQWYQMVLFSIYKGWLSREYTCGTKWGRRLIWNISTWRVVLTKMLWKEFNPSHSIFALFFGEINKQTNERINDNIVFYFNTFGNRWRVGF